MPTKQIQASIGLDKLRKTKMGFFLWTNPLSPGPVWLDCPAGEAMYKASYVVIMTTTTMMIRPTIIRL